MESAECSRHSCRLDGTAFSFAESMSGHIRPGVDNPCACYPPPANPVDEVRFNVRIRIPDLGRFVRDLRHRATLEGTIFFPRLGGTFEIRDGDFEMFSVDAVTGARRIRYSFHFRTADGRIFYFRGRKDIRHKAWRFDLLEDMTRLFVTIHRGDDEKAPLYGAGVLRFRLTDGPGLLASMQVEGSSSRRRRLAAQTAFLSVAWSALRNEYLRGLRVFYETRYENLVFAGRLQQRGSNSGTTFFLASGTHDKGFPWGDGELFWDALLAIKDQSGGYRRYCISDRVLPGLELDLSGGRYCYTGPIIAVADDCVYESPGSPVLPAPRELRAEIRLEFELRSYGTVSFPFPETHPSIRRFSSRLVTWLWDALPGTNPPGIHIRPQEASVRSGSVRVMPAQGGDPLEDWNVDSAGAWGECESGSFRNIKVPRLGYRYRCAIDPEGHSATIQVAAGTLRSHCPAGTVLSRLISRIGSAEMRLGGGALQVGCARSDPVPDAASAGDAARVVLSVSNTQFPTAVFQRRILETESAPERRCLALEESVSQVRLESIHSDRTATVASIRDGNPLRALDRALDGSQFNRVLEERLQESGRSKTEFRIAVKPNFMFAYDRNDRSTYTDPALVLHLVERMRGLGFEHICIVESQNSYGEYFDRRSVLEMAEYLGYDGSPGCEVVDLTLDVDESRQLGPALGLHPVPRSWRDAHFRISFAKNKTHAYSHYSLTIKNIYGALPLANKFKEYHCARGIYRTTIEYLAAFPVHFGIIDAHLSADGAFGVFANPRPNRTATIIAGDDLVAVDWVGAARMGLDPMKSRHMRLAVQQFGKPRIRLIGDAGPYPGWRKVPGILTLLTNRGMDASYRLGKLLYSISAQMDETHFRHKDRAWYVRLLRLATVPIRRTLFLRTTAGGQSEIRERSL